MSEKLFYAAVLIALTAVCIFAQASAPSEMPNLEKILSEAEKQTTNYREAFKNLLAVETKTFEKFAKNGEVKDRTIIESNFFVYQSSKNENISSELRNIIKVNDKPIPDSQSRADRFLGELQKAKTIESELEKIQNEGSRYDKTWEISGLTLYQAFILSEKNRPYFDFDLIGTENLGDSEVFVISYRQTKKSPHIAINEKPKGASASFDVNIPSSLKKSDVFLQGKLWIDAKTFQIRREQRDLVVQSDAPLVAMENILEYQPGNFELLVPKQISVTENAIRKNSNQYAVSKNTRITFDYSQFRKSDTEVIIIDDEN